MCSDDRDALTRRELQDEIGASQATLSRILQDFEDRQWIRKQGAVYEATAFGSWGADCVSALQEALSASDKLGVFEQWLPTDNEGFNARWLADAEVITPTETEPNAPMDRVQSVLRAAQHIRVLSYAYNKNCLDVSVTAVQEYGQQYEGVYSTGAIQSLRENPKWRDKLETMLEADTAAISVYEGEVPCSIEIADEVVHLILRDDQGVVHAVIESESIPLRNWVVSLFERYLADAESIDT